jgi:probable phosphoglycerate mutase
MRRLVLWRHGRTSWNAEHRFQGQSDIPLDEVGIEQARRAAGVLAGLSPDLIISSDLIRASATAAALSELVKVPVHLDPRLRETYAGEWQGLTRDEIKALSGTDLLAWSAGSDLRPGGGERRTEVAARVAAAVEDALVGLHEDGVLVVATHGGAARAAIGQLLELPVEHWATLGVLTNCAWSVLLENEQVSGWSTRRWRLQEYNAGSLPEPVPEDGEWPADDR